MVHGCLQFNLESEDRLLHRLAYQVAGIMMSSGNMKKNAKADEIVNSVYAPLIPVDQSDKPVQRQVSDDPEEARRIISEIKNRIHT